ncbi:hypothetical protein SDRG_05708 [Saprolegnia diclina VS20]|uniref:subtilisin n=1 Tax=Saprolegnia diclina (strain VS20) TaxID=1156394 RepID=T0RWI8_SAPDV|nr:hypothetical protein SDRG_05708 [Saprolegnia diclina VS20]EQC36878.1 hypothetical protein SDRG_05708 [Saprolegnia diclina VS20]|eukprot:XP_008609659.1 hypothetical protein SDRG_05708 [Saprolegnia diclina VS20]
MGRLGRSMLALLGIARMATGLDLLVHLDETITAMGSSAATPVGSRAMVYAHLHQRHTTQQHAVWDMAVAAATDRVAADLALATMIPLWIQNTMLVRGATSRVASHLAMLPSVRAVHLDETIHLDATERDSTLDAPEMNPSIDVAAPFASSPQANIKNLHADEAWALGFTGKGVTVASIDSGVRYSHRILARSYRGYVDGHTWQHDYAFWLAAGQNQTLTPDNADEVGHGTHTLGTAVGADGVGVAPGATWIAARPFNADGSAKQSDILLAAQWVMCPTAWDGSSPDCHRGADVVSNSFGGNSSIDWMDKVVDAWTHAHILPVFASGNVNGFECGSVLCPGCLQNAVAVGALVGAQTLWGGSGKGPGKGGAVKPDFVAPGVAIRSAASYDDAKFTRMTGTSMATPHVSGAAAILLQQCKAGPAPCVPAHVLTALAATTSHKLSKPILVPSRCGNTSYDEYPNNIYGHGLPNVARALRPATATA